MPSRLITPIRSGSKKTTIGFVNLGCSKNQVDSEVMLGTLVRDGFALTDDPKKAEVVIINTCGFIEEAKQEDDIILESSGVRLFVDGFSLQYLNGVTIDYVTSMQGSGFTFTNPNATGGCGCGSSFTA